MRHKAMVFAGSLLLMVLLMTGCNTGSSEQAVREQQESVTLDTTDVFFELQEKKTREEITVVLEDLSFLRKADFGEGRTSDALRISLFVDNKNQNGLQLHPDSGRIRLETGEEIHSTKGHFNETYPNGTMKRGDLYFPLQLTKLEEIDGMTLILDGPVDQYYLPRGEGYVFRIEARHPRFQTVEREELLQRAYAAASRMAEAPGVTDAVSLGIREEIGPLIIHLREIITYEQVEHPYGHFLNLEDPVNLLGITLIIENQGAETVYYSNARSRLLEGVGEPTPLDHLMSQYMGQEYPGGIIKTGAIFFQASDEGLENLTDLTLLIESPWLETEEGRRLLAEEVRIRLRGQ